MFRCKHLAALALLLLSGAAAAQTTPAELAAHPERSAGIYHSYDYAPADPAPVPAGYEPFYISHYGRHGSRYLSSESAYEEPLDLLRRAAAADALTPRGRRLLGEVEAIAADAAGRYGDLSPRGVAEHRAIAERMYAAYPQVFSTDGRECLVESRSTLVPRCILSMAAFDERLKEIDPAIRTTREASRRYLGYLANGVALDSLYRPASAVADSLLRIRLEPARLLGEIFSDPQFVRREVRDPHRTAERLFQLAGIMQDIDYLGISLYDLFTDEELYALWEVENVRRYLTMGPSERFGDPVVAAAKPLLHNIVETADEVIRGERTLCASLRFGHDVYITPLLALMGVEGASARVRPVDDVAAVWNVQQVSPMAANLQLIFFRNPSTGDVRVRVLHNERDARLPVAGGPYYPWETLRAYFENLYR